MTKKAKIIILVVVIVIAGGLLTWQILNWQGKTGDFKNYISSLFSGEEENLPDDVKAAYDALKNDPSDTSAYMKIALWKRDNGDLGEAIKLYEKALEIKPEDTLLLMNIADLFIRNKQYAEAAGAYVKVMESNPKWLAAYRSLADLYRYQMPERHIEIPSILKKGLEANTENELYFVGPLAIYYKDFGPTDEAIRWYERLLELEPGNITAQKELEAIKNNL